MGNNKALLKIHSKPQWLYLADLCRNAGLNTYISCRSNQETAQQLLYPVIIDQYDSIGPMGGILSAFKYNPTVAWLIIACDMPGINKKAISTLLGNRNSSKMATVFLDEHHRIDPLFSIIEPTFLNKLLSSYDQKLYSVKAVLENCDIERVRIFNTAEILQNINTPADLKKFTNGKQHSE